MLASHSVHDTAMQLVALSHIQQLDKCSSFIAHRVSRLSAHSFSLLITISDPRAVPIAESVHIACTKFTGLHSAVVRIG